MSCCGITSGSVGGLPDSEVPLEWKNEAQTQEGWNQLCRSVADRPVA
jgi:hypothetical protein